MITSERTSSGRSFTDFSVGVICLDATLGEWVSKVQERVRMKSVEGSSKVQLCKQGFVLMGDELTLEHGFMARCWLAQST